MQHSTLPPTHQPPFHPPCIVARSSLGACSAPMPQAKHPTCNGNVIISSQNIKLQEKLNSIITFLLRFGCLACGIGAGKSASRDSISALLSFMSGRLRCLAEKPRVLGVSLCGALFRAVERRPKVCRHTRSIRGARFSRGSSLRWSHPPHNPVRCGRVTHFKTQITESIPWDK